MNMYMSTIYWAKCEHVYYILGNFQSVSMYMYVHVYHIQSVSMYTTIYWEIS